MSSRRIAPLLVLLLTASSAGGLTLVIDGCGSDTGAVGGGATSDAPSSEGGGAASGDGGASSDSSTTLPDASALDASCAQGKVVPDKGETCTGFGKGTGCDTACGLPAYGYVCFNGGPPGFTGCVQASSSPLGETYCCPDNKCVPQPDQDKSCTTAGKTHRFQCPPDGTGGNVAPPAGCVDGGAGSSALELYYCCP